MITVADHIRWLPLFWIVSALAVALFVYSCTRLLRPLRSTRSLRRMDHPWIRLKGVLVRVFGQKKLFYDPIPGLAHALVFWGFCVILIESLHFFLSAFTVQSRLPLTHGLFYSVYEIALVAVLGAVAFMLARRIFFRTRIVKSLDGLFVLLMIVGLVLSGLVLSAQETALAGEPNPWKVVTHAWVMPGSAGLFNTVWWTHGLIFLVFLNYLPYSKHRHVLTVLFNVYFRDLTPQGRLTKLDLENSERFGLADRQDLTFKDILDGYTCTECGRCTVACPANQAGKHLDPKQIILAVKEYINHQKTSLAENGSNDRMPIVGNFIEKHDIFDCTTCHACVTACPVENEHLDKIINLRRNLVLMEGDMPPAYEQTFRNLENNHNPWGLAGDQRGQWPRTLGLPTLKEKPEAPYVFFLGCAGCYDPRAREVVKSLVHVLQHAGLDFAVLGDDEFCCGDTARRMGNEYLFQETLAANRQVISQYSLESKTLITADPHCFNTFKNEYPDFGISLHVQHHSTVLHQLLTQGQIQAKVNGGRTLVFHDSCYMGRYNDQFDEPRQILTLLGHRVLEMENHGRQSLCCGAGGGCVFMEEDKEYRVNVARVRQALAAGGDAIAVACPYCTLMFESGLSEIQSDMKTYDIAELVAHQLAH